MSSPTPIPVQVLPHGAGLPLPARASAGAAGFDLRAAVVEPVELAPGHRALVPCGIALAIPVGWEGQVRPRSGLAMRHGITLVNSPGTIDSDYRGELHVPLVNLGTEAFVVQRGERIAQIIFAPVPPVALVAVDTLPAGEGDRGLGGFGSTGRT
jgi:dUTP pyrophosphatase